MVLILFLAQLRQQAVVMAEVLEMETAAVLAEEVDGAITLAEAAQHYKEEMEEAALMVFMQEAAVEHLQLAEMLLELGHREAEEMEFHRQ